MKRTCVLVAVGVLVAFAMGPARAQMDRPGMEPAPKGPPMHQMMNMMGQMHAEMARMSGDVAAMRRTMAEHREQMMQHCRGAEVPAPAPPK